MNAPNSKKEKKKVKRKSGKKSADMKTIQESDSNPQNNTNVWILSVIALLRIFSNKEGTRPQDLIGDSKSYLSGLNWPRSE